MDDKEWDEGTSPTSRKGNLNIERVSRGIVGAIKNGSDHEIIAA